MIVLYKKLHHDLRFRNYRPKGSVTPQPTDESYWLFGDSSPVLWDDASHILLE